MKLAQSRYFAHYIPVHPYILDPISYYLLPLPLTFSNNLIFTIYPIPTFISSLRSWLALGIWHLKIEMVISVCSHYYMYPYYQQIPNAYNARGIIMIILVKHPYDSIETAFPWMQTTLLQPFVNPAVLTIPGEPYRYKKIHTFI